jgi:hypothetical protein
MLRVPEANLWKWPFFQSGNLPRSLVWANLYFAGINLLPAYPLDGGRILRAFSRAALIPQRPPAARFPSATPSQCS